jgi:hypothetical protein
MNVLQMLIVMIYDFYPDPEGTLFFDSVNDFPDNGQDSFYNVFHNTSTVATEKAVVVQFYTGTASQGPFYAEVCIIRKYWICITILLTESMCYASLLLEILSV